MTGHELRKPRMQEHIMQTLTKHCGDQPAYRRVSSVQLGLMPFWHDWLRASWRSLRLAWQGAWPDSLQKRAACAPTLPSLQAGCARRWQPTETGVLRVSAGRLWLTAWAPQPGGSQDLVLCAGQALWVGAGQCWLVEALDADVQLRWQAAR